MPRPILRAVRGRHTWLVQLLLNKGAEYDNRSHVSDISPVISQLLRDHGANPREPAREKVPNCMTKAANIGNITSVQMLIDRGVPLEDAGSYKSGIICNTLYEGLEMLRFLSENGISRLPERPRDQAVLGFAAAGGSAEAVEFFLNKGFDPNQNYKHPLVKLAARNPPNKKAVATTLDALIKHGAGLNKRPNARLSCHFANRDKDEEVQLLLERGAVPLPEGCCSQPFFSAVIGGSFDTLSLPLKAIDNRGMPLEHYQYILLSAEKCAEKYGQWELKKILQHYYFRKEYPVVPS